MKRHKATRYRTIVFTQEVSDSHLRHTHTGYHPHPNQKFTNTCRVLVPESSCYLSYLLLASSDFCLLSVDEVALHNNLCLTRTCFPFQVVHRFLLLVTAVCNQAKRLRYVHLVALRGVNCLHCACAITGGGFDYCAKQRSEKRFCHIITHVKSGTKGTILPLLSPRVSAEANRLATNKQITNRTNPRYRWIFVMSYFLESLLFITFIPLFVRSFVPP